MVREGPAQPAPYPAEKMREDVTMRTWLRRATFVGGLVAVVVIALVLVLWG